MDRKKRKALAIIMLVDSSSDEEEVKKKRVRRHSLFTTRNEEGVYNTTIKRHLMDNDTKFRQYFRLTPFLFHRVLAPIESKIRKPPSIRYPEPIEPKLKLCLTLRLVYKIYCLLLIINILDIFKRCTLLRKSDFGITNDFHNFILHFGNGFPWKCGDCFRY